MIIELLYFTIIHTCEHVGCRPYRRNDPKVKLMQAYTISDERTIYSPHPCKICTEIEQQQEERRVANPPENLAIRYMVDGHKMSITLHKGYWRGKAWVDGKWISKYFGKSDPRPLLEEVVY